MYPKSPLNEKTKWNNTVPLKGNVVVQLAGKGNFSALIVSFFGKPRRWEFSRPTV